MQACTSDYLASLIAGYKEIPEGAGNRSRRFLKQARVITVEGQHRGDGHGVVCPSRFDSDRFVHARIIAVPRSDCNEGQDLSNSL